MQIRRLRGLESYLFEFVVIVLGISVSLLVDQWRQKHLQNEEAKEAIHGLLHDLEADSAYLSRNLVVLNAQIPAIKRLADYLVAQAAPADSFVFCLEESYKIYYFPPNRASFDYIKLNNRLQLIGPDSLVKKILQLYDQEYQYMQFMINLDVAYANDRYYPYLYQHWDLRQSDMINDAFPKIDPQLPNYLLKDFLFRQHVVILHRKKTGLQFAFTRTIRKIKQMQMLLRARLSTI